MKVKDILKALEGAPADADVSLSIRAIKVATTKVKSSSEKKAVANPKPIVVKKPASKSVQPTGKATTIKVAPLPKPAAKTSAKPSGKSGATKKPAPIASDVRNKANAAKKPAKPGAKKTTAKK